MTVYPPYPGYRPRPRGRGTVLVVLTLVLAVAVAGVLVLYLLGPTILGTPGPRSPDLLFVALLFLLLGIFALRVVMWGTVARGLYHGRGGDGAFRIARRRYARGEITREQYQELVDDLAPGGPDGPGAGVPLPRRPPPPPL